MPQPPLPATAAGLLLAVGCAICAGIAAYRFLTRSAGKPRVMQSVAVGGLTFQVIHVLEHALQLAFWALKPTKAPWLSSWAAGTADGLHYICTLVPLDDTPTSLGVEMLHLTGNVIFLGALTAWQVSLRAEGRSVASLSTAEKIQLFHVAEHLVLVGSLVGFGEAAGLSTAFGLASGTTLVALRVLFHFSINAFATGFALKAAHDTWIKPRRSSSVSTNPVAPALV